MKILLVAHKYPPDSLGGVEVYTRHLAQALTARHEVALFYRHDDAEGPKFAEYDEQDGALRVRRVSRNPVGLGKSVAGEFFGTFSDRATEASFSRWMDRFQPDLVHVQHVMGLSAKLPSLARAAGVPVVLTLHDYWFLCGNSQLIWPDGQTCQGKAWGMNCVRCAAAARFPSPLVRWLRPALAPLFSYRDAKVRRGARAACLLVAPSRFLIDRYTAAGFPADRFCCLENGIPVDRIRRSPQIPGSGRLRVTFLGSLAWQKGVHVLARAWRGMPPGAARLRIWGDPALFPDYSAQVHRMLEGTGAEMLGRAPNERVGEVLADSDVVVVPSLWYENSPVVIQEAHAAGVPVVASGHGALAEKVRDGVDGLLFAPGDAQALQQTLLRLVEEPGLLARLRQNVPPAMDMAEHLVQLERIYEQARHPNTLL